MSSRLKLLVIALVAAIVVVLVASQWLARFATDYLWYQSVHLTSIWSRVVLTKIGLGAVFSVVAILGLWLSLYVVDRIAPLARLSGPEIEFVERYQAVVGRHRTLVRVAVALVVGVLLGAGASSQWQNFLLFTHPVKFAARDPEYGKNVSFFVFQLPFLSFVVNWLLLALFIVFVVSAIAHYLNGSIHSRDGRPRVDQRAIAHLSLLLGLIALMKAVAYFFIDRYTLETGGGTVARGAEYTGIHVRLPAIELLAVVGLACFALLVYNVYHRSLALPAIAVGIWALTALSAGVIFPALVQGLEVTPAASTLELPYLARNITATRAALGLNSVTSKSFAAGQDLTAPELLADTSTLDAVRVWDPSLTSATFEKLQQIRTYYNLSSLTVDRYDVAGALTPVVVGVRTINSSALPAESWVNVHLEYTHGYGAVLAPANAVSGSGDPVFDVGNIPQSESSDYHFADLTQPDVYYGTGISTFAVVDTKQGEVDYQLKNGNSVEVHYKGTGGERLSSIFDRLAFAVRFHDLNLLTSNLITSHSRIMFVQDVVARAEKAFPFLQIGNDAYPVVADGHVDWIVDGYTTSNSYPYAETADTSMLPSGSGLSGTYNYIRNSVKIVINGYSGKIRAYVVDPSDPIIESYESMFPGVFHPISAMPEALRSQLKYPQALLMVQSAMYGTYHITSPSAFYSGADDWSVSQSPGSGSPSSPLPTTASGQVARFEPVYEVLQLPGSSSASFDLVEPMVPISSGDTLQTLSAMLVAGNDPGDYGKLTAYVTPRGESVDGPALVNARINSVPSISTEISFLDSHGSTVLLGTVMMLPIDNSLVYVRPLYVTSAQNNFPQLRYVIVVYGKQVAMEPTLSAALASVFHATVAGIGVNGQGAPSAAAIPAAVRELLDQAQTLYGQALKALRSGTPSGIATYLGDTQQIGKLLAEANKELKPLGLSSKATKLPAATAAGHSSSSNPAHESQPETSATTTAASRARSSPSIETRTKSSTRSSTSTVAADEMPPPADRA
jgi:uncharacterized membrane protein (UPF0182 family)